MKKNSKKIWKRQNKASQLFYKKVNKDLIRRYLGLKSKSLPAFKEPYNIWKVFRAYYIIKNEVNNNTYEHNST